MCWLHCTYMRSYMLIGPFKCSQLRSRVRELGPLVLRSTNPLLPTLRFSVIKIQIYHSRRLKGEERDSKSRRKKARGSLSTVRAAAGFAELAQLRWSSLLAHCAQKIVSKKKKKHWTVAKRTLHLHIIARVWCPSGPSRAPWNIIARLSVCVCVSVRSINAWASNSSLNGGSTHVTSRLNPSGVGRIYFSSGPVRSVVAHSLPARFEILIVRARICMTVFMVLFQCKLWLLPALFILHCTKSGPPPSLSRCSITGSRTLAQQVEWCRCTCLYFAIRSAPFPTVAELRPSEGPQRSALVAESGPSGPVGSLQHYCACVRVCVCSLHKCMNFKQQFEWRLQVTSRPKLLVRSGPVVVAHSLPCQLVSIVSAVGERAPISWVVVAHSVPGRRRVGIDTICFFFQHAFQYAVLLLKLC